MAHSVYDALGVCTIDLHVDTTQHVQGMPCSWKVLYVDRSRRNLWVKFVSSIVNVPYVAGDDHLNLSVWQHMYFLVQLLQYMRHTGVSQRGKRL